MKNKQLSKMDKEIENTIIDPIVKTSVKDRPPSKLESSSQYEKRLKKSYLKAFHDFENRLEDAIHILDRQGKWPHDPRFDKAREKLKTHPFSEEEFLKAPTLQEILHFTDEELMSFYTIGVEMFSKDAYAEASNIFLLLTQFNPRVPSFWGALGAAEERSGGLQEAMMAYVFAAELDETSLDNYFHGARCLVFLHNNEDAKKILNRAIERAEENAQLRTWKDKAIKILEKI